MTLGLHLLGDLLPLHLQHLLLLVGVIDDVLSTDQQLALHRLRDTKKNTFDINMTPALSNRNILELE